MIALLNFFGGARLQVVLLKYWYYKTPTLTQYPTSRTRGLNLKGPSPHPRGTGVFAPSGKENATHHNGLCRGQEGHFWQKCPKIAEMFCRQTPVWGQKKPQAQVVKIVIISLQMFGGVPQPQTSRGGPKRPGTAVFRVFLMPPGCSSNQVLLALLVLMVPPARKHSCLLWVSSAAPRRAPSQAAPLVLDR